MLAEFKYLELRYMQNQIQQVKEQYDMDSLVLAEKYRKGVITMSEYLNKQHDLFNDFKNKLFDIVVTPIE
jgi:hypothetical protein